jgi:hypothetical protein
MSMNDGDHRLQVAAVGAGTVLSAQGLAPSDDYALTESSHRFDDGGHFRLEISGVERLSSLGNGRLDRAFAAAEGGTTLCMLFFRQDFENPKAIAAEHEEIMDSIRPEIPSRPWPVSESTSKRDATASTSVPSPPSNVQG